MRKGHRDPDLWANKLGHSRPMHCTRYDICHLLSACQLIGIMLIEADFVWVCMHVCVCVCPRKQLKNYCPETDVGETWYENVLR